MKKSEKILSLREAVRCLKKQVRELSEYKEDAIAVIRENRDQIEELKDREYLLERDCAELYEIEERIFVAVTEKFGRKVADEIALDMKCRK